MMSWAEILKACAIFATFAGEQVPRLSVMLTFCREIPHKSAKADWVIPLSASKSLILMLSILNYLTPFISICLDINTIYQHLLIVNSFY